MFEFFRSRHRFEGVPAEAAHYLAEAENEYRRILATGGTVDAGIRDEIERLLAEIGPAISADGAPATQVSWRALGELEQLVLYAAPDHELPAKLTHVHAKYERVLGADALARFLAGAGDALAGTDARLQRSNGAQMLREIYRHHAAMHSRELALAPLAGWMCFLAGSGLVLILLMGLVALLTDWRIPIFIPTVFFCGIVGAFISILRRIQAQRESVLANTDVIQVLIGLRTGRLTVFVGLFSGGIFALVLYLILISGFLGTGGGVLPKFRPPAGGGDAFSYVEFLSKVSPADARDYAMVLVWSIVAGFAERLVPDVLDRLQRQVSKPSP